MIEAPLLRPSRASGPIPSHLPRPSKLEPSAPRVKIALGQINPTVGDFSGNAAKIIQFALQARSAGAGLILFPELAVSGYPPLDLVERPRLWPAAARPSRGSPRRPQGIAVICGTVTPAEADSGKKVMNSAAVLREGRIDFIQSKMLLPTYDVFDEMRNFAPAKSQQLFSFCGKQMALTICEDAWNDKRFWNRRLYGIDPVEELVRSAETSCSTFPRRPSGWASANCAATCWRPSRGIRKFRSRW
jgi:NAD+ synthase (glutamine-hydrolysing)